MPRVSQFYGIVIYMYYNDHEPPHFHAEYGEFEAVYRIDPIEVLRGKLPPRAHSMVVEWARARQAELREDWVRARAQLRPLHIEPLD